MQEQKPGEHSPDKKERMAPAQGSGSGVIDGD